MLQLSRRIYKGGNMNFANGIKVRTYHSTYGDIINLGIDVEKIKENPINENGFVNITLKKGKSGDWYQNLNEYKKEEK